MMRARMNLPLLLTLSRKFQFPILFLVFAFITVLQYAEQVGGLSVLANWNENLGLTRYTVERIIYLLPVIWTAILFGWRGGVVSSALAVGCMLPRDILFSSSTEDAIVETAAVFVVGILASYSLNALKKEKEQRLALEVARDQLRVQLERVERDEKRLAALNYTSSIISQSLELGDVLDGAINSVIDVMGVEAVRIYILDWEEQVLHLAAHRGVSDEFVSSLRVIDVGEGFNGRVVKSGEPLYVENASEDPRLVHRAVQTEKLKSQLIVPMRAKGEVVGTLAVAMHSIRRFQPDEVELLSAVASQIGVAVANAQLFRREREIAAQLRASEQRYRDLFEKAHDAILIQGLNGEVIAANRACAELTGYSVEELCGLNVADLIAPESLATARSIRDRLFGGGASGSLDEIKLVRKDGTEVVVQLASSLVRASDYEPAIQIIARDVTWERRMKENLRHFVRQVTRAQEEERQRIAQELHDDTIQEMVVLSRNLDELSRKVSILSGEEMKARLEELYEEVGVAVQNVQRLSQDLRPAALDRLGLLAALEWLADREAKYSGMEVYVEFSGEECRLPDEVELVLFRIAQEALRNVWKHARASRAVIALDLDGGRARLAVSDNGVGFVVPEMVTDLPRFGKLGLAGMQERAELLGGTVRVNSAPGRGTIVTAEVPVQ